MFILNYSVKINCDLLYLTFESPDGSHIGLSLSLISYKDKLTDRYSQSTGPKARDKNIWSVYVIRTMAQQMAAHAWRR